MKNNHTEIIKNVISRSIEELGFDFQIEDFEEIIDLKILEKESNSVALEKALKRLIER